MSDKSRRKTREGFVVSDKMDKTVVVEVERMFQHPVYKRTVRRSKRYKAHDPRNSCRVGDRVRIMETRPLSKHKRWRIVEVVEWSEALAAKTEEIADRNEPQEQE